MALVCPFAFGCLAPRLNAPLATMIHRSIRHTGVGE